eukprot:TRINITY_DN20018_c0_g4_i1.p1 TRINITY_DN20018_c0_g4~~TRINITY_DN20018_c0_g4_i1.p1  ORF type:complete len:567 (+),score=100.23 TRINITY_DN20018_c0_g4_i1:47-1702(+)
MALAASGGVAAAAAEAADDAEYPGVRWVKAFYILQFLEDGKPMPRCQDLPQKAFGTLREAVRVFGVTHPWLGKWHPDPNGIQMETMRAKLQKLKKQMMLDPTDVVFFDYMSLPQVNQSGVDDRSAEEKKRIASALSGDLMGRIYLTTRVMIIDEVPKDAESATAYMDRGWCFFECMVASMSTNPRDLTWLEARTKTAIGEFRNLAAQFRENGDLGPLQDAFDRELPSKAFANASDSTLVRGFFASLAKSQRLIAAAARGDAKGVVAALDEGADPRSRNGQGRTSLHVAVLNGRVGATAAILGRVDASVAAMKTMDNETSLELARDGASRECQVLVRHKLGEHFPPIIIRTIEGDEAGVSELISDLLEACTSRPATPAASSIPKAGAPKAKADPPKSAIPKQKALGAIADSKVGAKAKAGSSGIGGKAASLRGGAARSAAQLVLASTPASPPATSSAENASLPRRTSGAAPEALAASLVAAKSASIDIQAQDDEGNTALHYAVSLQHLPIMKSLLKAKAQPDSSNKNGDSPLSAARSSGNPKIFELFGIDTA